MKLDARRAEGFLAAPGACRVVLLHGEDLGLIRERGAALVRRIAGALDDPFRVAELEREGLPRLVEEMGAQSLSGGRRVVRVRDVTDAAAPFVQAALASRGEALVVLEAGELTGRSKLRSLVEAAADAASIACYAEQGGELNRTIAQVLQGSGLTIESEAAAYLADNLGNDRGATRQELEKLAIYMAPDTKVDLTAAMAIVGDLAGLQIEDALFAATAGDVAMADRAIALAFGEGANPVTVLRSLLMHLHRIGRATAAVQSGQSADEAMRGLRPPVFFARKAAFVRATELWSVEANVAAASAVWSAEWACKQTGSPAAVLCRQALLTIARRAAARRGREQGGRGAWR